MKEEIEKLIEEIQVLGDKAQDMSLKYGRVYDYYNHEMYKGQSKAYLDVVKKLSAIGK
tara:strand:+ start:67 stop:240 length:174 start_codon:yes stop_codon:yes gene_type:complete